jgi:hypothetical protein
MRTSPRICLQGRGWKAVALAFLVSFIAHSALAEEVEQAAVTGDASRSKAGERPVNPLPGDARGIEDLSGFLSGDSMGVGLGDLRGEIHRNLSSGAGALDEDANWSNIFGRKRSGPSVWTAVSNGQDLYIGGSFYYAGKHVVKNVARWHGNGWKPVGGGTNGTVTTMAFLGRDLYVGGVFTSAAGNPTIRHIARWDGHAWSAVGGGVNGKVAVLKVWKGSIYVGGTFTQAGGIPAKGLARWDGSSWHSVGEGVNGRVEALEIGPEGDLYVGGVFNRVGTTPANSIARWDGDRWSTLGNGVKWGSHPGSVRVILTSGNSLIVGGGFFRAGDKEAWLVAEWNGERWSDIGGGFYRCSGACHAMTFSMIEFEGSLYACASYSGYYAPAKRYHHGILHFKWDGEKWSRYSNILDYFGDNALVRNMKLIGDEVLYCGNIMRVNGISGVYGIIAFDGSSWTPFEQHVSKAGGKGLGARARSVVTGGSDDLYVGGRFSHAGGPRRERVARWDGKDWEGLSCGIPGVDGSKVFAMAVRGSEVFAGGKFEEVGCKLSGIGHVARFHGDQWRGMGEGLSGPVFALAVRGDHVYAGGNFLRAGGVVVNHLAVWDGEGWEAVGYGTDGPVHALLFHRGKLYVGGEFEAAGGMRAMNIAAWDGQAWSAVGPPGTDGIPGVDGRVVTLASQVEKLYVGGKFENAGGLPVHHVACWDGVSWRALGEGTNDFVRALAAYGAGRIFAGGDFTRADTTRANHVAMWDGRNWHSLGSGVDDRVYSLAVLGHDVYLGGDFLRAGGKWSYRFGRWTVPVEERSVEGWGRERDAPHSNLLVSQSLSDEEPPALIRLEPNIPNPFNPRTTIRFVLQEEARVGLTVYDVQGRLVVSLVDRDLERGPHVYTWNGRDAHGVQVGSGIYFYRLEAGDFVETRKMILLK